MAYSDRVFLSAASTPRRRFLGSAPSSSSSSSSSRHSTTSTSTTFCSPFTRTAHTLDPLTTTSARPLLFSRYVVSRSLRASTNCNPRRCWRSRRWCRRCCCFCCCSCCCRCRCCIAPPSTSSAGSLSLLLLLLCRSPRHYCPLSVSPLTCLS